MELEGSIPNSQDMSTCPYPEPDQSSPHHPILSLQDPSQYYSLTSVLVFLAVSFPPTTYMRSSSPPFVLHAQPISSSSRLDYSNYTRTWRRVQITKLFVTQYSPPSRHLKIFSSAPCSQTPSVYVPPLVSRPSFATIQNHAF
jgi:hypothetical protein